MRIPLLAMQYFSLVFAAGFVLALVRIPILLPRYGIRTAELIEIPVMLLVIGLSSHWIHRRNTRLSGLSLLSVGGLSLLLMIMAELGVAVATSDLSPLDYVLSRDPVSGTAYLLSLVVFALAPWLWSIQRRT